MNLNKFKNIKEPFVLVLIGVPLSGKSTFCEKFIEQITDADIISRDTILMEMADTDNYNDAYNSISPKAINLRLNAILEEYKKKDSDKSKRNVIIDMMNLSSKRRKVHLTKFPFHYKVAVIFPILSIDEYMKRNSKRKTEENKDISENLLKNLLEDYKSIKPDEGFDKIIQL